MSLAGTALRRWAAVVPTPRTARGRTLVSVALGLSLGAAATFTGALLRPRRPASYDPRSPR